METIKIVLKNEKGWNRINLKQLPKIVANSRLTCRGEYTDDYAHDNDNHFSQNLTHEECKKRIETYRITPHIEWDNELQRIIISYGQSLSFLAEPTANLNLVFIKPETTVAPADIQALASTLEKAELLGLRVREVDCGGNREGVKTSVKIKKKYFYVDVGTSGRYLIDADRNVFSIKAYGQKGYFQGDINKVLFRLGLDIETMEKMLNEPGKMHIVRLLEVR